MKGVAGVMGWAIEGKETVEERKSKKKEKKFLQTLQT